MNKSLNELMSAAREREIATRRPFVIYHGSCADGFSAAWVYWKRFEPTDAMLASAPPGAAVASPTLDARASTAKLPLHRAALWNTAVACAECEPHKLVALDAATVLAVHEKLTAVSTPIPDETQAAKDVLAERQRQIASEGWDFHHDDQHNNGSMAAAAACYLLLSDAYPNAGEPPVEWPWNEGWWKPKDYRRDLIRAGALVLAEIERIDRAAMGNASMASIEEGKASDGR